MGKAAAGGVAPPAGATAFLFTDWESMNAKHRTARLAFLGRRRSATAVIRRETGRDVAELRPTRHDGTQGHPLRVIGSALVRVARNLGGSL